MEIVMSIVPVLIPVILVIMLLCIVAAGYVKARPDQALIISGPFKNRILIGRAGIKIPFVERMDRLDLSLIPIDVKTSSEVPTADYINVRVDSTVNVKIGKERELLDRAAVNFLNMPASEINSIAREVLEGNVREIVGQMRLEEMVSDRQKFAELVKTNAAPDLAEMGLEIVSFNVQNFVDANGVIENLGVDNVVRIQKNAAISRAQSERDIAIEKSKAAQEANNARVEAEEVIAQRNAQLETEKARLKANVDTQMAQAEAAKSIENENQRKLRDIAATNANIAKAEREAELKQKEIELKEYELTALVRKQADADKYAAEKKAEADLVRRQRDAEAKAYEIEQQANAQRVKAEADRYEAEQKAAGIALVGEAEAKAIREKAEAQKLMGEASVIEMYLNVLPQIVANAAAPLTNVDSITMYGDGNSTKLVGDVMNTTNQVLEAMSQNGIDLKSLLSGFLGGKAAQ
jgi:flotillin